MDKQISVRIPTELARALAARVRKTGEKRSDVVREALQQHLGTRRSRQKPADRVRHLIGSVRSGIPDLAERHRDYILDSLTRAH